MSGINYDLIKIRAFVFDVDGVLSPSTIPMSDTGEPMRMVNIKDGYALQLAAKSGYKIAIITGGRSESVKLRYKSLHIEDVFIGAGKKIDVFKRWIEERGLAPEEVMYMGDDIPDLECLRHTGLACAPSDACREVLETADYVTLARGGYGCAREVIEQVMRVHGDWLKDTNAFGW